MKVIMDSDSLIKLTKSKVKEIVVENMDVYIPVKVYEETVTKPKKEGFPDALKTVRLTSDMLKGVAYRAKMEDIDEYTAIRQLMKFGVMWYAVNLYKIGKITLSEAAELSDVSVRKMLDILEDHGIKGNVTMKQQIKALEYAKKL